MENNIISLSSISKTFDDLEVIRDISLSVNEGEIVCILGPSGSGKTTLLKIIAGLEKVNKGTVQSIIKFPSKKLGYMSQADSLLPWRTAHGNIKLALELIGKKNFQEVETALKSIQLEKFRDYYPSELSGGQCQRINLARTLILNPKLLLLDEPLSSLDIVVKNDLSVIIKSYVKNNNAGALIVTHSVGEALTLADTIHILTNSPAVISKSFNVKKLGDKAYNTISDALQKAIRNEE